MSFILSLITVLPVYQQDWYCRETLKVTDMLLSKTKEQLVCDFKLSPGRKHGLSASSAE